MKPTLANIEKRVASLENSLPKDETVILTVVQIGAKTPDFYRETIQPASGRNPEIRVQWPQYHGDRDAATATPEHRRPRHSHGDESRDVA